MTKFPPREIKAIETDINNDIIQICDCSHPDFIHEDTPTDSNKGECRLCKCPFFNFQHKTTYKEWFNIFEQQLGLDNP